MPTMWANPFLGFPLIRDTALVEVLSILAGILPCQRCCRYSSNWPAKAMQGSLFSLNVTLGNVTLGRLLICSHAPVRPSLETK